MTIPGRWRKSTFSGQDVDCVEVANNLRALQDSKNPGVVLSIDLVPFLAAIKRGDLR